MAVDAAPPLGVAGAWGAAEIALAHRFDELHQLIYRRGGLPSSNAAVEELAKLLLLQLWAARTGAAVTSAPDAFAAALAESSLQAADPTGGRRPIWPADEPFRLGEGEVLAAASGLIADILAGPAMGDPLGTAFDALLAGRYDHTGGLGTYLTPSGVARMMAEIALPLITTAPEQVAGPGFGDPYCGTGRFLVAALTVLRQADSPLAARLLAGGPFGADVSGSATAKAAINLLLYGRDHPLVWTVHDSATDATLDPLIGRVPLILTNPPFGEGQYDSPAGIAATAAVLPRVAGRARIDPSVAGLARSIRLLAPGGVLGIVLPDGVLASTPVAELLRGSPATDVSLVAAVSLPTATFALSGTAARTSAVFLRRGRPTRARRVALARVDHVGYLRQAGRAAVDPAGDQLPAVARSIVDGLAGASDDALVVVSEQPLVAIVAANAMHSLDPARLDPTAVGARQRLLAQGGVTLAEYLTALPPRRCRTITTPYVSVLHVDELGAVDWHAARTHTPTTPGALADPGDLIVSLLNPARLRAAVVPAGPAVQVSSEFGVFRAAIDPYAVLALLYTPDVRSQLRPLGSGTSSSRRRISADDVLALVVPKLLASTLDDAARAARSAYTRLTVARADLHRLFSDVTPS